MSNNSSKRVTALSYKQSTRRVITTTTVVKSQTTSSGCVNPYGSSVVADRAPPKTYEPVYEKTRQLSRNTNTGSHTPKYQVTTQSATHSKDSNTAGSLFYTFPEDKKGLENDVPAKTVPNSSLTNATAALKIVTQEPSNARSNTPASPGLQPKLSATQSTSSDELKYDLTKPAAVVIFHHLFENVPDRIRPGSQYDYKLLMDFFNELNAKVIYNHQDPKVKKVRTTMENVRKKDFCAYSCLIIVIMSHGDIKNQICALDGNYNLDDDIVQPTTDNKSLKGKPKIFIVQACKGHNLIEADCIKTVPSPSDILICFSTYEGTPAFRNVDEGTYFIQTLIKKLKERPEKSIMDIMPLMRSEFESKRIRQVPAETTTLTKSFFFRDLKKKPKPK